MRYLKWVVLAVSVVLLMAQNPVAGGVIYVTRFTPPPGWRAVYHEVAVCANLTDRGYDKIAWYWVNTAGEKFWRSENGDTVYAVSEPKATPPRILMPTGDTTNIRHEMLHVILNENGWHPSIPEAYVTQRELHPGPWYEYRQKDHMFFPVCGGLS